MDELWVRAVESAIDGRTSDSPVKTLTLDGAVTCFNGRLPPPILFEKFQTLEHLSIANVGLTSLEMFPRLWNLQRLVLSDNRISGGLEFLVEAGLRSLRDLDLSNNRIESVEDLLPLAQLDLVSLDLYECPVTRVSDYRGKIFGLIKSLKCLDKLEEDEDDGEIDGGGVDLGKSSNGSSVGTSGGRDGIIDVHEIEESDEDGIEEERDGLRIVNVSNGGLNGNVNGYRVGVNGEDEDGDDEDGVEEERDELRIENVANGDLNVNVSGDGVGVNREDEDVDGDNGDYSEESDGVDEGVEEVQEIEDNEEEEEGVENEGGGNDEYENEEEVEHDVPESSRTVIHSQGEIDGHEEGEEDSDNDGEYEENGEEDEELGFLVQPVGQAEDNGEASDVDPVNEIDDGDDAEAGEEIDDEYPNREFHLQPSSSSQVHLKRKRPEEQVSENDEDDENDSVQDG